MKQMQETIAKAIIFNEHRTHVLLLHNADGYWDLPGGRVEFEETPEQAIVREGKEEANLSIEPLQLCSMQTIILDGASRTPPEMRHYLVLVYVGRLSSSASLDCFPDGSIDAADWIPIARLGQQPELRALSLLDEQIHSALEAGPVRTTRTIYLRMGEVSPYREITY